MARAAQTLACQVTVKVDERVLRQLGTKVQQMEDQYAQPLQNVVRSFLLENKAFLEILVYEKNESVSNENFSLLDPTDQNGVYNIYFGWVRVTENRE